MDYIELITLWEMVKAEGVVDEVAQKLGIKKSSLKRQMRRIIAWHQGEDVQSRSGKRIMDEYIRAMRYTLEKKLGRPILTAYIETPRKVVFTDLKDALRYSQPISHISSIRLEGNWIIRIPINSDVVPVEDIL
jgi:hypothetical protein